MTTKSQSEATSAITNKRSVSLVLILAQHLGLGHDASVHRDLEEIELHGRVQRGKHLSPLEAEERCPIHVGGRQSSIGVGNTVCQGDGSSQVWPQATRIVAVHDVECLQVQLGPEQVVTQLVELVEVFAFEFAVAVLDVADIVEFRNIHV
ncbi:uncharacterized protein HMPREF1120_06763 [Exophiala dermatitidis NIH/UT8656]|uniref:Uncharacterized protein n=1 Tax=Exophiala dermatitidis (strain ATCC 34100 / CBS 525.76 / NIH/UT8656) TaxID=858893 RepID=H6C2I2_EXODN|nr:uncharacterized protein HMPREF1120_06763 [Exophiala dermatitidis NIH/UT8656]EHY58760.1 hypothetical protein HMPREF1120_06763 [Exophiala dermatitidis NIH/UT8656]